MTEEARKQRNKQRLGECFPAFALRVEAVIKEMEDQGFRPRIQDAHRTIEAQKIAHDTGKSDVLFGFHNVTGASGKPEALAVDLLDDNRPLAPSRQYVIRLAATAQKHALNSGIFFRLTPKRRATLRQAIEDLNFSTAVEIGFDPTHIEATGLTIAEAGAGKRPS
jgi:hypothetical protein